MNRLKTTYNDGIGIKAEDFTFMDESVRDVLKGIMESYKGSGTAGFIISGCIMTETTGSISYTDGYVYFNNEVFKVRANTVTKVTGAHYVFAQDITYDSHGDRLTKYNATNIQVWEIRQASLVVNTDSPFVAADYVSWDADNLDSLIYKRILNRDTGWQYVGDTGQPVFEHSYHNESPLSPVCFRKDSSNTVLIRGWAKKNTSSGTESVFTLPIGFRPTVQMTFIVNTVSASSVLYVNTDGSVYIISTAGYICFDNIQFKID